MSAKTYANMMYGLTGVDLVTAYLANDVESVKKIFDDPIKRKVNDEITYDFLVNNDSFSTSNHMRGLIEAWGQVHNMHIFTSSIHTPQVDGGTVAGYRLACSSVKKFYLDKGLFNTTSKVNEEELEEEKVNTKSR